jgi:hypothetical protein
VSNAGTIDEELGVAHAAKTKANAANIAPFFNCMFIDLPPNEFIRIQYKRFGGIIDEDCVKI